VYGIVIHAAGVCVGWTAGTGGFRNGNGGRAPGMLRISDHTYNIGGGVDVGVPGPVVVVAYGSNPSTGVTDGTLVEVAGLAVGGKYTSIVGVGVTALSHGFSLLYSGPGVYPSAYPMSSRQ